MTIICLARLVKTKRIDQLILATAKLNDQLIIVGTGPQEKYLHFLAHKKVQFFKNLPRKKLINLLKKADLFCLPSVVEGFGIATIEAMASGLPAILADIPVNREITKGGKGSIFFEPGNITDLAAKIKTLIDNKTFYHQKQVEALKLAKSYTWDKVYLQTKAVYESCLHH